MRPRGSTVITLVWGSLLLGVAACAADAALTGNARGAARDLTSLLGLTDTALFNEARYTRHPALGDWQAAFQDGPASLDHFPSGSLLTPPRPGQGGQIKVVEP